MSEKKIVPGTGGDHYVPYDERTGNESIVYFTRDLSAEGLQKSIKESALISQVRLGSNFTQGKRTVRILFQGNG